jgi:hypothetical protein
MNSALSLPKGTFELLNDRLQFQTDLARQTQKITKPTTAPQMIDHSLLDEVLAGK